MQVNATEKHLATDPAASTLVNFLRDNEQRLGLVDAQLYYDFPVLKDLDDVLVIADILVVSPEHGVLVFGTSGATAVEDAAVEFPTIDSQVDRVFSLLYSRLIRNKTLKKSRTDLVFPTNAAIAALLLNEEPGVVQTETKLLFTYRQLEDYVEQIRVPAIPTEIFAELIATIEGAKGIIRPKVRNVAIQDPHSKGYLASQIESEIASFDQRQKQGYMSVLDGLQRIRGLAGSGKTVVLAMKAALTHLRYPDSTILYTFYTRSLYQHIQRLITRFYRQFDDQDPDWNRLRVLHAWGGTSAEGVYFNACKALDIEPISFEKAARKSNDPFNYVCTQLLANADIKPAYDFIFVDEGQDFPASYIQLCVKLAERSRVVFAYDDLQTIFQAATPTIGEIVGTDNTGKPLAELSDDVILYKCYRNPREIIVCAHALGFGIYGSRIVQMLENKDQWEDIGYRVLKGDFVEDSETIIERPSENSLTIISDRQEPNELVRAESYDAYPNEISGVAEQIRADIGEGLRPDDILVVVVDDRHARAYLNDLAQVLAAVGIKTNNIHEDAYAIRDFSLDGRVTLSTVHKAKGNEAFMVYVVGVDALFSSYAGVRERNVLFTAMTRAKGWVRVSGIGNGAAICKAEIETALQNFPLLNFKYPSQSQLKILRRDLAEKAALKQRLERNLDEILKEMSPEEIKGFIEQRSIRKGVN